MVLWCLEGVLMVPIGCRGCGLPRGVVGPQIQGVGGLGWRGGDLYFCGLMMCVLHLVWVRDMPKPDTYAIYPNPYTYTIYPNPYAYTIYHIPYTYTIYPKP
ncbi:hypothetical protein T484DRAFT_1968287 [Baffinella frigidus]|nr:hypothetical protein T484DRAFT_1968287 [Cryptophyta sp. CCMP2293]